MSDSIYAMYPPQGSGRGGFMWGGSWSSFSSNGLLYLQPFSTGVVHSSESSAQFPAPRNWRITSIASKANINGKDDPTDVTLRVAGADTAATVQHAAGATDLEQLTGISVRITVGQLVSIQIDTSASSNGSTISGWVVFGGVSS